MDGKLGRIVAIGALVAALVLPGLMAVAGARGPAITDPETIELAFGGDEPDADASADYHLRSPNWRKGGLNMMRGGVLDQDGNAVGNVVWNCISSKVAWLCDLIATLKHGPYTQAGQVMISGPFRGFNGESLAVVGGTGPYANTRGEAILSAANDTFFLTLELQP